ncbi:MAG: DUF3168 domain-containing protein [Salinarimonas sp.]
MILDLQQALRARLVADPALAALVPAENVVDRTGLPERFPCVIFGEGQIVPEDITLDRRHARVFVTLHVWAREPSSVTVKRIAEAVRGALRDWHPGLPSCRFVEIRQSRSRFLRGQDGETANAVVNVEALVEETAP